MVISRDEPYLDAESLCKNPPVLSSSRIICMLMILRSGVVEKNIIQISWNLHQCLLYTVNNFYSPSSVYVAENTLLVVETILIIVEQHFLVVEKHFFAEQLLILEGRPYCRTTPCLLPKNTLLVEKHPSYCRTSFPSFKTS
jgi:hypothetical protein